MHFTALPLASGIGVGAALSGYLADNYGRRHVLIGFSAMTMLSTAMQSVATSWLMFICIRCVVGIFIGQLSRHF